jgi:hypothetical protein
MEMRGQSGGRFTPEEMTPRTNWKGGWVGSQSRSGRCGEEKSLAVLENQTRAVAIRIPEAFVVRKLFKIKEITNMRTFI